MNRIYLSLAVAGLALITGRVACAAGAFDGAWRGSAEQWTVDLVVSGTKGALSISCGTNKYSFDVPVAADGTIDAWVSAPGLARRNIRGKLPTLVIPPGGSCRGGEATLVR